MGFKKLVSPAVKLENNVWSWRVSCIDSSFTSLLGFLWAASALDILLFLAGGAIAVT